MYRWTVKIYSQGHACTSSKSGHDVREMKQILNNNSHMLLITNSPELETECQFTPVTVMMASGMRYGDECLL